MMMTIKEKERKLLSTGPAPERALEKLSPHSVSIVIPSLDRNGASGHQVTDDDETVTLTIFAGPAACVHAEAGDEKKS